MTLPMPTRGPYKSQRSGGDNRHQISGANGRQIAILWRDEHTKANSDLIIAAFNAATAAADLGFDPIAAVQALPELLRVLNGVEEWVKFFHGQAGWDEYTKSPEVKALRASLAAARTRKEAP